MSLTDRELLELAAKAVGINGTWCQFPGMVERRGLDGAIYDEVECEYWNPLQDDGDALRLALELEMPIHPCRVWKSYRVDSCSDFVEASRSVMPPSDPAATRRAIVDVAAEIGKAMQEKH